MHTSHSRWFTGLGFVVLAVACSAPEDDGGTDGAGGSVATGGGLNTGTGGLGTGTGGLGVGTGGGSDGPYVLPEGYTAADKGGFKLGLELTDGTSTGTPSTDCGREIRGLVRDFRRGDDWRTTYQGHKDFEIFYGLMPKTGLVLADLGADLKPVYSGTGHLNAPPEKQMTSEADFLKWYNDSPNTPADTGYGNGNRTFEIFLSFEPNGEVRTFQSAAFFPLDGQGFGNETPFTINDTEPVPEHNYHFTTEVHTKFRYNGGEVFSFDGDDDLWVFVNKKLALDLGGLHPSASGSIDLDAQAEALGLTIGQEYPLDFFHAERGMPESNYRVDTSLQFTECGIIVR